MATTAGGTPYVESSDLVANYPAVSLALAEHIDDLPAAILQVVRATDTTSRTTTSTTFVDASLTVTITPQKSTSSIMLIWSSYAAPTGAAGSVYQSHQITDNSNNPVSGAETQALGGSNNADLFIGSVLIGYATPATTAATTYKARFSVATGKTARLQNSQLTGQLYAIEVSA